MPRFFARLRSAVLECPGGCGRLYDLRAARGVGQDAGQLSRRYWDPLSGRFECPGCGEVSQLGIVAYRLPKSRTATIPADWRPTIPQAVWMRDQARGVKGGSRPAAEQGANLVEGADWGDVAELGAEVPPAPKPRVGRPPSGGPPSERSPHTPATGTTWRQQRKQQQQPTVEEGTSDDASNESDDEE